MPTIPACSYYGVITSVFHNASHPADFDSNSCHVATFIHPNSKCVWFSSVSVSVIGMDQSILFGSLCCRACVLEAQEVNDCLAFY